MRSDISKRLLDWYAVHARDLPWRKTEDPYAIWVAEIMLQQTRVDTVIPYFERWLKRFPDIQSLAKSNQQDVLQAWEGLGYYSRVRNFHRAAQIIIRDFDGSIPNEPDLLLTLPGIGKAGAADIASIAFAKDIGSVDGNIRRVVSRLLDLTDLVGTRAFENQVQDYIDAHLPPGKAGDYNQAWMDLGSSICTIDHPACDACPLGEACLARKNGTQSIRPVRRIKTSIPEIMVTAGIMFDDARNRVLLTKRPEKGLLGGLWEYPGGKLEAGETLEECLVREWMEELNVSINVGTLQGKYRHAYSHFKVILYAFFCVSPGSPTPVFHGSEYAWVSLAEVVDFPMGKIDRMISRSLIQNASQPQHKVT